MDGKCVLHALKADLPERRLPSKTLKSAQRQNGREGGHPTEDRTRHLQRGRVHEACKRKDVRARELRLAAEGFRRSPHGGCIHFTGLPGAAAI